MEFGWTGRRLIVNLSGEKWFTENIDEKLLRNYIGGRGINSRFVLDIIGPDTDPLGPDNVLIIGVGPVTGTLSPGSSRVTFTALSPIVVVDSDKPGFGDSNMGGFFGPEIKYAGYDQIVIKGRAKKLVYLWIDDDEVEIRDAASLWGKDTSETVDAIREELDDDRIEVACIGPAGENLCRMASIIGHKHRAAGKCGIGAVMGSKSLKAIAVRGTKPVKVAHPEELEKAVEEAILVLQKDPSSTAWSVDGTPVLVEAHQRGGRLGTMNFQHSQFEHWEDISADSLWKYWTGSKACFSCPVHCDHFYKVNGSDGTFYGGGPEYVAVGGFGSKCGNRDLVSILEANNLCNRYGMDVLNVASTIAWSMECWQRGLINKSLTHGLELKWGDGNVIKTLIRLMAHREGRIGKLLAEGAYRAAKKINQGAERFVVHVRGQDPALSDGRAAKAWGLAYAVSSRGGDHLRALATGETFFTPEEAKRLFGTEEAVKRFGVKGKGRLVKWSEDQRAVADCLETCKFIVRTVLMYPKWMTRFFNAVTGFDYTEDELMRVGERVVNTERVLNVRLGLTRAYDTNSERFLKEPIKEGPAKGETLSAQAKMLDEYYEARGWDLDAGFPGRDKLEELGLKDLAEILMKMGRLGKPETGASRKRKA